MEFSNEEIVTRGMKALDGLFTEGSRVTKEVKEWLIRSGFLIAPASTKYHGNYPGGLMEHSLNVALALAHMTRQMDLKWQDEESPFIIGVFHDICKADQYIMLPNPITEPNGLIKRYEYNNNTLLSGHADKSLMLLSSHLKLTDEEMICIRYHMGAFSDDANERNAYSRAVEACENVLWVHTADMYASHVLEVKNK